MMVLWLNDRNAAMSKKSTPVLQLQRGMHYKLLRIASKLLYCNYFLNILSQTLCANL